MSKCQGISCKFAIEGIDLEKKSVPVILSDESEVVRFNFQDGKHYIRLLHGEENVDLSRKDILALFINHNTDDLPTAIFEDVRIEDKKSKANAVFDEADAESMKIFNKLSKGFLKSFSVGIDIIEKVLVKEENGFKYYDVTRWALNEASVVGIPAIPNAKVGLKNEDTDGVNRAEVEALAKNQKSKQGEVMNEEQLQALKSEHAEALTKAKADGAVLERERVSAILALHGDDSIKQLSIKDGLSIGETAIALNASLATVISTHKTDFEAAAAELNKNNVSPETEALSKEEQLAKEADDAIANLVKGK